MAFLCLQIYFFKQMKYVDLTCLLGGSLLTWSVVLVVLLCINHSLVVVFCVHNKVVYYLLYFSEFIIHID
jgi:hypothetical protein